MTYRSIDLFAGVGGIRLGFEEAFGGDIETVFVSEWNKFSNQTALPRGVARRTGDKLHGTGDYREQRETRLFPSEDRYHDPSFPSEGLTLLGAKTTCKDRWRQVLSEADRINVKHLVTLEPSISVRQTNDMRDKGLQLVVPTPLHTTYKASQREWLWSVTEFFSLVEERERTYV